MAKAAFESDTVLKIEGLGLARGGRERTRIRTLELPDGTWVEVPLIVVRGANPGPVCTAGINAFFRLLTRLVC